MPRMEPEISHNVKTLIEELLMMAASDRRFPCPAEKEDLFCGGHTISQRTGFLGNSVRCFPCLTEEEEDDHDLSGFQVCCGECPTNPCTWVTKNRHRDITGKNFSSLDNVEKYKETLDWFPGKIQRDHPGLVDAEVKRISLSECMKNTRFDSAAEIIEMPFWPIIEETLFQTPLYLCKRLRPEEYEKNEVEEDIKRILSEYKKNSSLRSAAEKSEKQFRPNIDEILCNKRSSIRSRLQDIRRCFGECLTNLFTWAKKDRHRDIAGNMFFHLDNNELNWSNRNVSRDSEFEFQHGYTYVNNQEIRKEIVRRFSSFVVSTVAFLGIVYNIWNSQLLIINVPPLHKEHHSRRLSIWLSLLVLFGFMAFVCAVAVMILIGAAFTSMQKAMLIIWVMLFYLQSANSISEVFVTLVGGIFLGWYAFGKKPPLNESDMNKEAKLST